MDLTKVKELLEGNEKAKDIIKEIEKQNGLDLEPFKTKVETLESEKATLEGQIKDISKDTKSASEWKEKHDNLVQQIEAEKTAKAEQEAKEKAEKEFNERFTSAVGTEKEFSNEFVKESVFNRFKNALGDEKNKGKGDKELFEEIVKDQDVWVNPNNPKKIPGANATGTDAVVESTAVKFF